ncbi:sensor histidine kinase [Pseudooceanicola aestuarii]|uniref:sensor histidine kinase n=1 Tax=Pseudooceanicola aestuarii TaxID=2697319 RepID=UPI0013D7BDE6|nr:hypothetical protein [Pseudooceanicola aestuarii]
MRQAYSPVLIALSALGLGLGAAALVLWAALAQPWLGLELRAEAASAPGFLVQSVDPRGPAAGQVRPGSRLIGLRSAAAPPPDAGSAAPGGAEGASVERSRTQADAPEAPGQGTGGADRSRAGPSVADLPASAASASAAGRPFAGALHPSDLIDEPDTLPTPDLLRLFLRRQGGLHMALTGGPVVLSLAVPDSGPGSGSESGPGDIPEESAGPRRAAAPAPDMEPAAGPATVTEIVLTPAPSRPLSDLPGVFWVQIAVGLVAVVVGGWVMALRRSDRAVQMFVLAGVGLMLSAYAAALYSTRELALPQGLFTFASRVNYTGTLLFGVGMINLFLIYPARLEGMPPAKAPAWRRALAGGWLRGLVTLLLGLSVLTVWLDWPDALLNRQIPVAWAMLVLLGAVLVQAHRNRRNPTASAMLGWFGLSVLLGAGGFGLTVTLPVLMGTTPRLSQGHAFLFFLVIYGGLAMGIARYRLFDLADWSFRILFYLGGMVLLLALDAALIYVLALDRAPALGLALALVGVIYLPLRDLLGRWLQNDRGLPRKELFALVGDVTLASGAPGRARALEALLHRLFDPLRIDQGPPATGAARLLDGGEVLDIPMPQGLPAIRLHWARQGRGLFSRRDERLARSVTEMLDRAIARQRDHDRAVEEERSRINRDMHDNIGVQLLGALHSHDPDRKDSLIRQTLSDLRQIISNPTREDMILAQLLADLRREIGDHLEAADIALDWRDHGLSAPEAAPVRLPPGLVQTLRALLRESVSNILRHSGAGQVMITLWRTPDNSAEDIPAGGLLRVTIADDGTGGRRQWSSTGNGLVNLRYRIEGCGGTLSVSPDSNGARIDVALPLPGPAPEPGSAVPDRDEPAAPSVRPAAVPDRGTGAIAPAPVAGGAEDREGSPNKDGGGGNDSTGASADHSASEGASPAVNDTGAGMASDLPPVPSPPVPRPPVPRPPAEPSPAGAAPAVTGSHPGPAGRKATA